MKEKAFFENINNKITIAILKSKTFNNFPIKTQYDKGDFWIQAQLMNSNYWKEASNNAYNLMASLLKNDEQDHYIKVKDIHQLKKLIKTRTE